MLVIPVDIAKLLINIFKHRFLQYCKMEIATNQPIASNMRGNLTRLRESEMP